MRSWSCKIDHGVTPSWGPGRSTELRRAVSRPIRGRRWAGMFDNFHQGQGSLNLLDRRANLLSGADVASFRSWPDWTAKKTCSLVIIISP